MSGASFRASNTQQGLTENMQILTGQKGDRLDKALTLREAAALGMVNLRRNGSGQIVPELPPDKPTDPEWSGVQQPVAPTGVTADGAFHTITLTWDTPAYKGHSYAEILRAEVDNPSKAVSIGTTLANVYSDAVGKGFSAFYWVRFVNKNGMVGPYHSAIGLHAETSKDIQDIINELDGKIKISHFDQWLKQDYEGVKETAASLESGVGSMWAVKASASQINAGIGLVAKSDGTSQVFIAASQVFVYDPNNPNNSTAPLFAIDQGKAVIQEAMIRSATIQIIHSEKITADYIKAGVSISAPLITGGQIDMGNAFMSGGSAGFGKGGPYAAWGWGWYTMIYADGSVYTNRLRAEGGYVRNMTIGNCTIEQDCIVKGTVYADRIVGDVTKMLTNKAGFNIPAYSRSRNLILVQGGIVYRRRLSGSGSISLNLHTYLNGVLVETSVTTVNLPTGGGVDVSVTAQPFMVIPANTDAVISFTTTTTGNVSDTGPEYNDTSRAVWLMALA
ncbi:DUF1983 domain-containing protein [Aeromonas jandaei]|uniref:DUF1983 domain-containing protein n=1 Tax=Aeromonas jandaei TaxID=650 RepID=A0A7T4A8M7_AERJA|nr:DUF1983 domain-containing protein [Aeromonas jandaei]QQB19345.1 DUF1983 domain-containing protein [Aeromonas jandaei]UCA34020.1 DUF1983 domain-containing protein [Aeromonas jandaei]